MAPADVLVIGGGIVGVCAAIRLAEAGAAVTIVDAAINAGSSANAGSLHVQMQSRFMRLYPDQVAGLESSLPFYRAAVTAWEQLEQATGPFELIRKGGLMLAESDEQMRFLEAKALREARQGLDVDLLDRAALDRVAPWMGPQIVGAELCRNEGKLNPLVANIRLRARAAALGVVFRQDRIVALGDLPLPGATGQSGRTYPADRVLIAAAWGAGDLVRGFGLAMRTQAEPLHMNVTEPAQVQIHHLIQHAERSITLKQFGSGQIVIGGGWPALSRGNAQVPSVLALSMLGNVALAARLVPAIGGLRVIRTWAGMNTTTDGRSTLGKLPRTDRIILAVPGDAGYTLGPLCGRMAAEIALGILPQIDPAPFDPARFSV